MKVIISPKHGVNPCIPVCFWCGESKNEIILLGKLKEDKEAPRSAVFDREPCDKCKAIFAKGVHFIEATQDRVPTGNHFVLTREAAERFINDCPEKAKILELGKVFVLPQDFVQICPKKEE